MNKSRKNNRLKLHKKTKFSKKLKNYSRKKNYYKKSNRKYSRINLRKSRKNRNLNGGLSWSMFSESPQDKLVGMGLLNKKTDGKYEFNTDAIAIEDGYGLKPDFIEFLKKDENERDKDINVHHASNHKIIPYPWFNQSWFDKRSPNKVDLHKQDKYIQRYYTYFSNDGLGLRLTKEEIEILSKYAPEQQIYLPGAHAT